MWFNHVLFQQVQESRIVLQFAGVFIRQTENVHSIRLLYRKRRIHTRVHIRSSSLNGANAHERPGGRYMKVYRMNVRWRGIWLWAGSHCRWICFFLVTLGQGILYYKVLVFMKGALVFGEFVAIYAFTPFHSLVFFILVTVFTVVRTNLIISNVE